MSIAVLASLLAFSFVVFIKPVLAVDTSEEEKEMEAKIKELEENKKKNNDNEFDFNNKDETFIKAIIYCSAEPV